MSVGAISSNSFATNLINQETQNKTRDAAGALSGGGRTAGALAALLGTLLDKKYDEAKEAIKGVGGPSSGSGGSDSSDMLTAQMQVGQFSAFSSAATNTMNTVNESQKEIGRNSR